MVERIQINIQGGKQETNQNGTMNGKTTLKAVAINGIYHNRKIQIYVYILVIINAIKSKLSE